MGNGSSSLRFKMVIGGILAMIVPLVLVGVFAVQRSSKALAEGAKQQSAALAGNLAAMTQMVLEQEVKLGVEIAALDVTRSAFARVADSGPDGAPVEVARLTNQLSSMMGRLSNGYESVIAMDASGKVFTDGIGEKTVGISLADRDYFIAAKAGKISVGKPVKSKNSGKPIAVICVPMKDARGQFAGALGLVMKMDAISEKIAAVKVGRTGYPFMAGPDGMLVAHPNSEFILELDLKTTVGMENIARRMVAGENGVEDYVFKEVEKIAAFAPVPLTGWSIAVTQDRSEFMATAHQIRNVILAVGGVFLLLTFFAVVYFARSITRPIQRIIRGLNEGSDQVAQAAGQVAASSQSLAEGSSEQAASIEETSSSLEEMRSMTNQSAANARQADQMRKEGQEAIRQATEAMRELTGAIGEVAQASGETQKIVKTIDEISFQTNLLALNAAVEAARAGEAGAGFAVVADEVRNLAMRAAEAAKNTAALIEGTVSKVNRGAELVEKTNAAFAEVTDGNRKVGELVGEIAQASIQQAEGIKQINQAVSEMDKVTQQNAAGAEESASAAEEMAGQAEQIKAMVRDLGGIIIGSRYEQRRSRPKGRPDALPREAKAKTPALKKKAEPPKAVEPSREVASAHKLAPEQVIPLDDEDFSDF